MSIFASIICLAILYTLLQCIVPLVRRPFQGPLKNTLYWFFWVPVTALFSFFTNTVPVYAPPLFAWMSRRLGFERPEDLYAERRREEEANRREEERRRQWEQQVESERLSRLRDEEIRRAARQRDEIAARNARQVEEARERERQERLEQEAILESLRLQEAERRRRRQAPIEPPIRPAAPTSQAPAFPSRCDSASTIQTKNVLHELQRKVVESMPIPESDFEKLINVEARFEAFEELLVQFALNRDGDVVLGVGKPQGQTWRNQFANSGIEYILKCQTRLLDTILGGEDSTITRRRRELNRRAESFMTRLTLIQSFAW